MMNRYVRVHIVTVYVLIFVRIETEMMTRFHEVTTLICSH